MAEQASYERRPILIVFRETSVFKETYGGALDRIALMAHWLKPEEPSDTVLVFMHPVGGQHYLPVISALAGAGLHVLVSDSRYRGADSALIMEKVAVDLGAMVRHARERLGYKRVVLVGWSGGGSLSLFYQAQAERPTVHATPAGDPPDLAEAGLTPADGIVLQAAHISRHQILTEWLDPSILDEADPDRRDAELDLYDPANPNQPPYAPGYVQRYRTAQVARNRRITAWVRERLDSLRATGREREEHAFVVHGTMADPRWLDPTLEPNGRKPNWCYLGDPRTVNNGPVGLARFTTLRSWLSQWSIDDAQGDGPRSAASISIPALLIENGADDACTPSHAERLYQAIGHDRKERYRVEGANHYYFGQLDKLAEAVGVIRSWLDRHGFDAGQSAAV